MTMCSINRDQLLTNRDVILGITHVILTASSSSMCWHRVSTIICYDTIPSADIGICDELRRDIMETKAIQLIYLSMTPIPRAILPSSFTDMIVNGTNITVPSSIDTIAKPFERPLRLFVSDDAFDRLSPVC